VEEEEGVRVTRSLSSQRTPVNRCGFDTSHPQTVVQCLNHSL
jgi:hypothetical protein